LFENFADFVLERAATHDQALATGRELQQALTFLQRDDLYYKPNKLLKATDGKGFYAPQTLAMAYGVLRFMPGEFHQMVYETVNLGGDTDSTASIVAAAITFANGGDIDLPEDV